MKLLERLRCGRHREDEREQHTEASTVRAREVRENIDRLRQEQERIAWLRAQKDVIVHRPDQPEPRS